MTILDMSVPYLPVLMELKKPYPPITASLPQGYHFLPYEASYRSAWISLHVRLGQIKSMEEGERYFAETFDPHMEDVKKYFLLVVDEQGQLAGTSSIWYGEHFGQRRMRVHWVGVDPAHQCRGIARALMKETIALYEQTAREEPLYLATQTNSYVAIRMYLQLGFRPYKGAMPRNFHGESETFVKENERAWRIIEEKIAQLEEKVMIHN